MIGRVLSGSFESVNIMRQRKWQAQRANQPPGSDELFLREEDTSAATPYLSV